MQDAAPECRKAAANALTALASKDTGCTRIIAAGGIPPLLHALKDTSPAVREAAYLALLEGSRYQSMKEALVACNVAGLKAIPYVLSRAASDLESEPKLSVLALRLLGNLAHVRPAPLASVCLPEHHAALLFPTGCNSGAAKACVEVSRLHMTILLAIPLPTAVNCRLLAIQHSSFYPVSRGALYLITQARARAVKLLVETTDLFENLPAVQPP